LAAGRHAFAPVVGVKPVDGNERWGKVADHSVVRCRASAVANANPNKPGFIVRPFLLVAASFGGSQRWTTEWSTTLAIPLLNPSSALSRLMEMNVGAKSRTTPWSAAGFRQSQMPTPQTRFHRSTVPAGGRVFGGGQRWTTEWSTTLAIPLLNPYSALSRLTFPFAGYLGSK
jgi:hypothetical protein